MAKARHQNRQALAISPPSRSRRREVAIVIFPTTRCVGYTNGVETVSRFHRCHHGNGCLGENLPIHAAQSRLRILPPMTATLAQPRPTTLGSRVLARSGLAERYAVRLARDRADLHAAQTLRFLVFNVELNEGLEASYATCRDADPFDEVCDHLVVEERASGDIVGTYRLQTGAMAAANRGFYSAGEFDFAPLAPLLPQVVELGRACVHSQHRNIAVLALLWRGIALYARERGGRYLVGCSSLPTVDPAVGTAAYSQLMRTHLAPEPWHTVPVPAYDCPLDQIAPEPVRLPRLLTGYFSLGAKICGPPALDREFRTIDFLTVLDLEQLPPGALG